jgi:hypothetical protein
VQYPGLLLGEGIQNPKEAKNMRKDPFIFLTFFGPWRVHVPPPLRYGPGAEASEAKFILNEEDSLPEDRKFFLALLKFNSGPVLTFVPL